MNTVIVIDDEKNITLVVKAMLEKEGYHVQTFNHSPDAMLAIKSQPVSAVVTDLFMPEADGMNVLKFCKDHKPQVPVIMITAHGTVESAVSALKQGAFDFISKPFDRKELTQVVEKAVQTFQRRQTEPTTTIVGQSLPIREALRTIQKIAKSPSTVLIHGESGTGKELVALEIHRLSDRSQHPFIKVNCAAIPATLIESELFGYEKGAFTGAVTSKPGRFELADGGTLFLDEIGEMPLEMQVKMLRVLQEQEYERVGGIGSHKVNVRILAATNKDLAQEVKKGRFREDLFYRLNVVPLKVAPLRERVEDIELLTRYFIEVFNEKLKKEIESVESACLLALKSFHWPGNVRQLENVIERMMLMAEGPTLRASDLPDEISHIVFESGDGGLRSPRSFKEIVRQQTRSVERDLIHRALDDTSGNVTRAAEKLGLSRKGLQIKIKELGVRRTD